MKNDVDEYVYNPRHRRKGVKTVGTSEAHWPNSLPKSTSLRFKKSPCLKKIIQRQREDNIQHQPLTSRACTHACTPVCPYTHKHCPKRGGKYSLNTFRIFFMHKKHIESEPQEWIFRGIFHNCLNCRKHILLD